MLNISKLFGKSPFAPLQRHMKKVNSCIKELYNLFKALATQDMDEIQKIAKIISKLEHEADLIKNDIRNHLPKSLFLPINRFDLLEILSLQDAFADKAEDIAVLCSLQKLKNYKDLEEKFELFCKKNLESFFLTKNMMKEFDGLLEASFGGAEAQKVKEMIEELAIFEHEIDMLQYELVKQLFSITKDIDYSSFYLWHMILKEISQISNLGEKLGNRIRMILEIK